MRSVDHAYSRDGGLAVLTGNLASRGCIVKTAGVPGSMFRFEGPARIFESQDVACEAILADQVRPGDIVVIRYEGPRGGPGMQEMLYPTTYLKAKGLASRCALVTDGRFSGGSAGLSIGHVSPEAASGGVIGLIEEGDRIRIDIGARRIDVLVSENELTLRQDRRNASGWKPALPRRRQVSAALKAYALLAADADLGATRQIPADAVR